MTGRIEPELSFQTSQESCRIVLTPRDHDSEKLSGWSDMPQMCPLAFPLGVCRILQRPSLACVVRHLPLKYVALTLRRIWAKSQSLGAYVHRLTRRQQRIAFVFGNAEAVYLLSLGLKQEVESNSKQSKLFRPIHF